MRLFHSSSIVCLALSVLDVWLARDQNNIWRLSIQVYPKPAVTCLGPAAAAKHQRSHPCWTLLLQRKHAQSANATACSQLTRHLPLRDLQDHDGSAYALSVSLITTASCPRALSACFLSSFSKHPLLERLLCTEALRPPLANNAACSANPIAHAHTVFTEGLS